ncbi:hypothetical protein PsorP6_006772 [Peronosclerospora sorghi]|uniref:Uncharacterized protein n=1 Tax=Peronosclerospora sorghi TaxID=230839 RepID=A0ACC0W2W2_9STRA|nr:hypothetical protein PsorP6_006772 [Peronosclerospora sorghi]
MDMRSLIHEGSSPTNSGRSNSSSVSSNATVGCTASINSSTFPPPITSSTLPMPPFVAMRQQPTIFQRSAAPSDVSQASTLAPLRFIIPNSTPSCNNFRHSLPASTASHMQHLYSTSEPELEPQSQHLNPCPDDSFIVKTEQQEVSAKLDDVSEAKKIAPKRTRSSKLSSRSTKSKARPGLRKGKWTEEESQYAARLTYYFKEGLLPLERGTMLRLYLSQKLNCEPMRITKKFTGGECIGKQVFRPCSPTPESRVRIMQAQLELVTLEAAFIKRLKKNREEPPVSTDEFEKRPTPRSQLVPLKPRMYHRGEDETEGDEDEANAVGLLLDFFYKANRNEKESGKKIPSNNNDDISSENGKEKEEEQIKKELIETRTPTSPATISDMLINSPTKRMRALSVSGCVDPATAKRSRVGSLSTVTAA